MKPHMQMLGSSSRVASDLDTKDGNVRLTAGKMERHIYTVEDRLLGRLMHAMGDYSLTCRCSDHGTTPLGLILDMAHVLNQAGPQRREQYRS